MVLNSDGVHHTITLMQTDTLTAHNTQQPQSCCANKSSLKFLGKTHRHRKKTSQNNASCEISWRLSDALHYRHNSDVIMGAIASQITSVTIVYSTVYWGADQRKHHKSASLAFVRGTHRWPVNSPHKWPVTRIMFPFDDVIMRRCSMWREFLGWRVASPGVCVLLVSAQKDPPCSRTPGPHFDI